MSEMYADNYVKPRVIPILLVVLLLILGFWMFAANITLFKSPTASFLTLNGLGFCALVVTLVLFAFELFHRLRPVRTYCDPKNGIKVTNFYLGWWGEVERTEYADGSCSTYSTSNGATYIDPRELVKSPQFEGALTDLVKQARDK